MGSVKGLVDPIGSGGGMLKRPIGVDAGWKPLAAPPGIVGSGGIRDAGTTRTGHRTAKVRRRESPQASSDDA
jgi:hypothetical protein